MANTSSLMTVFTEDASASYDSENGATMSDDYYRKLPNRIRFYAFPFIFVPGILGNLASLAVMTSPRMRVRSTCAYLSLLAIADSLVNLHQLFVRWLPSITDTDDTPYFYESDLLCKLEAIHRRLSTMLAAWAVVLVSFERFLITWFPVRSGSWCSLRNARICIIALILLVLAYAVGEPLQFGVAEGACDRQKILQYQRHKVTRWLMPVLYSFLPLGALISMNAATAIKLRLQAALAMSSVSADKRRKMAARATKVILIVSTSYLVLTVPITVFFPLSLAIRMEGVAPPPAILLADEVCYIILLINHSINFYVYILSSRSFRAEAGVLFRRWFTGRGGEQGGLGTCVATINPPEPAGEETTA